VTPSPGWLQEQNVVAAKGHGPETKLGNKQTGAAELFVVHGSLLVGERDREVAPLVEFLALRREDLLEDRDGVRAGGEAEGRLLGVGKLKEGLGKLLRIVGLLAIDGLCRPPRRAGGGVVVVDNFCGIDRRISSQELGAEIAGLDHRNLDAKLSEMPSTANLVPQ